MYTVCLFSSRQIGVGYFELTSFALLHAHMYFQKKPAMKLKVAMMLGERQVNDSELSNFL